MIVNTWSLETTPIGEGLGSQNRLGHVVKSQVIFGLNPKQKFDLGELNSGVIGLNSKNTKPTYVETETNSKLFYLKHIPKVLQSSLKGKESR